MRNSYILFISLLIIGSAIQAAEQAAQPEPRRYIQGAAYSIIHAIETGHKNFYPTCQKFCLGEFQTPSCLISSLGCPGHEIAQESASKYTQSVTFHRQDHSVASHINIHQMYYDQPDYKYSLLDPSAKQIARRASISQGGKWNRQITFYCKENLPIFKKFYYEGSVVFSAQDKKEFERYLDLSTLEEIKDRTK